MVKEKAAFYKEHKTEIQVGVSIAEGVAAVSVPTALGAIGVSTFVDGVLGGCANVMTGGEFSNGFIGGAVNGWITSVGTCFGMSSSADALGGFVGNYITESLNNRDTTGPKKGEIEIMLTSAGMGFTQFQIGQIKTLGVMSNGVKLPKGSVGYWVAKFFIIRCVYTN